jgi:hypothetical protein
MSKGINVYDQLRGSFRSILEAKASDLQADGSITEPCIFLSHIRGDKKQVKEFGEYIKNAGINIYLDVDDEKLKAAVDASDDEKITYFIEVGIRNSTDLMIFLSDATRRSWWVPYEIGFGKAATKRLSCVKLRDVKINDLSYLRIVRCLRTPKDLDAYLDEILNQKRSISVEAGRRPVLLVDLLVGKRTNLTEANGASHPLSPHMNDC